MTGTRDAVLDALLADRPTTDTVSTDPETPVLDEAVADTIATLVADGTRTDEMD